MSESVSSSSRSTTSRRALIGGLTLGAAAVLAETVKPSAAQATQGHPVIAGLSNTETAPTVIENISTHGSGAALELHGAAFGGPGLFVTSAAEEAAIQGSAQAGDGVAGWTAGIAGGSGVSGVTTGIGKGVLAVSAGGVGLQASGLQMGVHAISNAPNNTGVGLQVEGRTVFRTAGVATVASGTNRATVTLAGVTPTDMVLATVQQPGAFYVNNAVAGSGKLSIYLNKVPVSPATVKVAWFVISAS